MDDSTTCHHSRNQATGRAAPDQAGVDTGPAAPLDEVDGFVYEAMRDAELVLEIATNNRPPAHLAGRPGAHEIAVAVHVVRDPAGKGTLARLAETTGGVTGRPEHRHMRPAAHRLVAGNR